MILQLHILKEYGIVILVILVAATVQHMFLPWAPAAAARPTLPKALTCCSCRFLKDSMQALIVVYNPQL